MTEAVATVRDLARRSQAAAGANDREAWLGLFTPDAIVQDPVGPSPLDPAGAGHRGAAAIAVFYDTVIAQVDSLRFEIERSYLCGDEVADVGSIHMSLPGGQTAVVRGVFTYRGDGNGRLSALRAYWEFGSLEFTDAR
ncbi:nuclear transport factor 2 family protein [Actinoplanes sp. NEAU-A12]|uniref:Nuclear transport factor 2 family protein n=1 Tax=Actinoplanes sandaracinus TaxID=3045177 RepID=A0ABT6WIB6_9ACTN|nr:nuclear transport factor 2 family protein [Actinoplanes sandaracinus]MDI6099459.1 nuclear transport factor 2 family protein [Actinoplanes sandaracinus]